MAKLSTVYATRARRVQAATRAMTIAEAEIALEGVQEEVQTALERSPLPRTGDMLRSIKKSIRGNGTRYVIGFDKGIAIYAPIRAEKKGISKLGGHLMDMSPSNGVRRKRLPLIRAMRRARLRGAIGPGARSVNGG